MPFCPQTEMTKTAIHNTYMIGNKWSDIPRYEARVRCSMCKETESMQHILIDCHSIARHLIWAKAEELWPHGQQAWPGITIGTIMGIGSITLPGNREQANNDNNARSTGTKGRTRLLQIIISEASHLIWVLRCERAIRGTLATKGRNRLLQIIISEASHLIWVL